jgi:3-hydroxyisobutyrate dehydrogenase-like beta-hydroxyacid dehydrogenase
MTDIALLGLGEVGTVLAQDLRNVRVRAWDVAFADPASPASGNAAGTWRRLL